jgi:hypothetical protein
MEIGSTGPLVPNQATSAQAAPPYAPPAASKKAPDSVNERKEAERSDEGHKRDDHGHEPRKLANHHLGQNLDIAL